jgi:CIC family chloride channel protein
VVVGVTTGVGAHLFYELLELGFSFTLEERGVLHLGRFMLLIVPMIGALACGLITHFFAREARGHGVPEVMDATYRKGGVIRPRVALAKAVSSALTIGSGGSAGTEGPIVQIGAAIGSSFGQAIGVKRHHMNTLVACGVAGGIAAIFNAPIAGVLFALEIFLRDFSFKTFSPIVFASVISTSITHALRPKDGGIFEVASPEMYIFNGVELPNYLLLGGLCALGSLLFIKVLYAAEDIAERSTCRDGSSRWWARACWASWGSSSPPSRSMPACPPSSATAIR